MTNTDDRTERDVREAIKPGALRHERRRRLAERKRQRRRELYACALPLRHRCNCQHIEEKPDASTTANTEEETNQ